MSIELIHPMLVHFPIVLFIGAVALDALVLARGGDIGRDDGLATAALVVLVLGVMFAVAAAVFGDIAFDVALDRGFPKAPLERHEGTAFTALWIFGAYAAARLLARWRKVSLAGWRGGAAMLVGVVGLGVLLTAAYYGGALVYEYGVNVARGGGG